MKGKRFFIMFVFFLFSCQSKSPTEYDYAADYARAIYNDLDCGGVIYASTKPAGYEFYNDENEWEFLPRSGSGCQYVDLLELMRRFCVAKDGQPAGEWCDQRGYPLFRVYQNKTYENKGKYGRDEWLSHAKDKGFLTLSEFNQKIRSEKETQRIERMATNEDDIRKFKEGMDKVHGGASTPAASEKLNKLSQTLKQADRQKRAYEKSMRDSWAYKKLGSCHTTSETEFQEVFIRFTMNKYTDKANQILFDPSPEFARKRQELFGEFLEKEYFPKAKDFYLSRERCPNIKELPFNY